MTTFKLQRTGDAPLVFDGELLAEDIGRDPDYIPEGRPKRSERPPDRWHNIAVYRTSSGAFVVSVSYRSTWRAEPSNDSAVAWRPGGSVRKYLRSIDPCEHVVGYPPDERYAEKQRRLRADITARYDAQVSRILETLGIIDTI